MSDDGTISLPHTGLSGPLDSADGTVRASYREGGITTNGLFNIVTAEGEADGSIWQPWTVAVVLILVLTWQIWVNRPRRMPTGQIGRHAHPG
ncbi:hypothetical protein M2390_000632 [Mycetocola sp. BIGb0189]|uniref:hypothetical protein n=1 Tax=Mycetocola sp. BIGb0189 TaxID=2940604 RepID=UPI0021672890|nr:hypothetical protein [Mycetocola sp. BIGb0189]MCS4275471.1 hypothetical protein [Mycetocola sp. BIGb0189]